MWASSPQLGLREHTPPGRGGSYSAAGRPARERFVVGEHRKRACLDAGEARRQEERMYIGGGVLLVIVIILLIYLLA
jgi:hypothetical protein